MVIYMNYIRLDKNLRIPAYHQIAESISNAIDEQKLKHGDKLPSETDVSLYFEVSIIVVKKAYDVLVKKGVITKVHGKGSFVNTLENVILPLNSLSQVESFLLLRSQITSRVLYHEHKNNQTTIKRLFISSDSKKIIQTMVLFDTIVKPKSSFKNCTLSFDLVKYYFPDISFHEKNHLTSHDLTLVESQLLGLSKDDPSFLILTSLFDDHHNLLGKIQTILPAIYYDFEVTL